MKFKKLFAAGIAVCLAVSMFSGCSKKSNANETVKTQNTSEPSKAAEKSAVTPAVTSAATPAAASDSKDKSAASGTVSSALKGKRIGIAALSMYDEWCTAVRDEFLSQKDAYGLAEVNIQDGNFNIETQQRNLEDFISQKYDAILVDVVDGEAVKSTLDKAAEAGIPVLCYDSGTNWDKLVSFVAWDQKETGRLTAQWVANYAKTNLGGKVKIGMLTNKTFEFQKIRGEAFKEELAKELGSDNIEYVFEQDFAKTREGAANVVTNNIAKPIDVIWGPVDNAAFGACNALKNANKEGTIVVSAGGWGKETFNAIKNNDPYYKAVLGVPPAEIVKYSYQTLADSFDKKTVEKNINIPLVVIDKNNIDDYMKYVK